MLSYDISNAEPFNDINKMMNGYVIFSKNYLQHKTSKYHVRYTKIMIKSGKCVYLIVIKGSHNDEILKGDKVDFILNNNGGFLYKGKTEYKIYPFELNLNKRGGDALNYPNPISNSWGNPKDIR